MIPALHHFTHTVATTLPVGIVALVIILIAFLALANRR